MLLAVPSGGSPTASARARAPRRLRAPARRLRASCSASTAARLILVLVLLGAYYAATDGVLMALGARASRRTCAAAASPCSAPPTGLARLVASVLFGALWTWLGARRASRVRRRARDRDGWSPRARPAPGPRACRCGLAFAVLCGALRRVAVLRRRLAAAAHAEADRENAQQAAAGRARRPAPARRQGEPSCSSAASTATDGGELRPAGRRAARGDRGDRCSPAPSCERVDFARATASAWHGGPRPASRRPSSMRPDETGRSALAGVPSRARVSPDGRYGGVTAFVDGHTYARRAQFSTAATIIDMAPASRRQPREVQGREGRQDHRRAGPQLLGRHVLAATATRSTRRSRPAPRLPDRGEPRAARAR